MSRETLALWVEICDLSSLLNTCLGHEPDHPEGRVDSGTPDVKLTFVLTLIILSSLEDHKRAHRSGSGSSNATPVASLRVLLKYTVQGITRYLRPDKLMPHIVGVAGAK